MRIFVEIREIITPKFVEIREIIAKKRCASAGKRISMSVMLMSMINERQL